MTDTMALQQILSISHSAGHGSSFLTVSTQQLYGGLLDRDFVDGLSTLVEYVFGVCECINVR